MIRRGAGEGGAEGLFLPHGGGGAWLLGKQQSHSRQDPGTSWAEVLRQGGLEHLDTTRFSFCGPSSLPLCLGAQIQRGAEASLEPHSEAGGESGQKKKFLCLSFLICKMR